MTKQRITIAIMSVLLVILAFLLIKNVLEEYLETKKSKNKINSLINGLDAQGKAEALNKIQKEKKQKEKKEKKYPFKPFFDEYIYFGGQPKKMLLIVFAGYIIMFVFYYIFSNNIIVSLSFAFYFFLIYYLFETSILQKRRMAFLKSFSSSLEIISSALEAGNALETAIKQVTQRTTLDPKIIREFSLLNNNLVSGLSLEDALDSFWKRNDDFTEITMFVILVQFFSKSGGKNMKAMFTGMKKSINEIIEGYSEIDSRTSIYNYMLIGFTIISILFTFAGKFIITDFYGAISGNLQGYMRLYFSMILLFSANLLQRSMVKNAAEA